VNHLYDPNVAFVCRPGSGKWRVLFEVVKPIQPGDIIVVSYGGKYFKDGGITCLCGSDNCIVNVEN
jgi:hypothetical protein